MKESMTDIYAKNGGVEDMEDIPKQQVERHDGLGEDQNLKAKLQKNDGADASEEDIKKMVDGCGGEAKVETSADKLGKFIEVIIKIK